jgi:hypothetical protein
MLLTASRAATTQRRQKAISHHLGVTAPEWYSERVAAIGAHFLVSGVRYTWSCACGCDPKNRARETRGRAFPRPSPGTRDVLAVREEPSWEEPIRFIRQLCRTDATLAETPAPEIGVILLRGCQRSHRMPPSHPVDNSAAFPTLSTVPWNHPCFAISILVLTG